MFIHLCVTRPSTGVLMFIHLCVTRPSTGVLMFIHLCVTRPSTGVLMFIHLCVTRPSAEVLMFFMLPRLRDPRTASWKGKEPIIIPVAYMSTYAHGQSRNCSWTSGKLFMEKREIVHGKADNVLVHSTFVDLLWMHTFCFCGSQLFLCAILLL